MSEHKSEGGDGRGVLYRDAKLGNLVNSVAAAGTVALIGWLSDLDFSSGPGWAAALGGPGVGLLVGWLTSKVLPRFKRRH